MAQLVKLFDCVTRYERDIYRYPRQYIKLKKQQWERFEAAWENGRMDLILKKPEQPPFQEKKQEEKSFLGKLKWKRKKNDDEVISTEVLQDHVQQNNELNIEITSEPKNKEELKLLFLDKLFSIQLKWASSTVSEISYYDKAIHHEQLLKFFLQRLPDHYFLFYRPVLKVKNADIEIDLLLISPTDIYCMTFIEEESDSVFQPFDERFWLKNQQKKVLNPNIQLSRMGSLVKSIIENDKIDMPVHKYLICRNGYIDERAKVFDINILDKRHFQNWFRQLRVSSSPIKYQQLKASQSLLNHTKTTAYQRMVLDPS